MCRSNQTLRSFLAMGAIAWQVGCSSGGVAVPDVPASVAMADFCNLYNEITCAASLGCCKDGNVVYASLEECRKQVSCPANIEEILQSSLLASGVLVYDASAAADYLRGQAAFAKACGATTQPVTGYPFISGTRSAGADCSPSADDSTPILSCRSGLSCSLTPTDTGTTNGVCAPATATASAGGEFAAACTSNQACLSGLCESGTCAVQTKAAFCQAPRVPTTPSNGCLDHVYITSPGGDGLTNDSITVKYYQSGCQPKSCTMNSASVYLCVLSDISGASPTTSNVLDITLTNPGTDGLNIKGIEIGASYGYYSVYNRDSWDNKKDCTIVGFYRDSFWLDKDGNGSKNRVQWYYNASGGDDIYCYQK